MASAPDGLRERLRETQARRWALVACGSLHVLRLRRSRHHQFNFASTPLHVEAQWAAGTMLIVTDQSSVDYASVLRHAPLIGDTRNVTRDVRGGCRKVVRA